MERILCGSKYGIFIIDYFFPSRYSLLNISTNRKNSDSNSGPKITPMNPNSDRPITTPNMVIRGCISAIFLLQDKADQIIELRDDQCSEYSQSDTIEKVAG